MDIEIDRIREELSPPPVISGLYRGVLFALGVGIATVLLVYADAVVAEEVDTLNDMDAANTLGYVMIWTIYAAHQVPIEGGGTVDFIGFFDSGIPEIAYFLLPPIFLFFAGRTVARATGHDQMANESLGVRGAFVAVGYLPMLVAGTYVFEENGVAPALPETILIAGLAYPVVFGFLGGYTAKY